MSKIIQSTLRQTTIVCFASLAGGCIGFVANAVMRVALPPFLGYFVGAIVWPLLGAIAGFHLGFVTVFKNRGTNHQSFPIESMQWQSMVVCLATLAGGSIGCVTSFERQSTLIGAIIWCLLGAIAGFAGSYLIFKTISTNRETRNQALDMKSERLGALPNDPSFEIPEVGKSRGNALGCIGVSMAAFCWVLVPGFIIGSESGLELVPSTWRLVPGTWGFVCYLTCVPGFTGVAILINAIAFHRNPLGWGGTGLVAAIPVLVFSVLISVMILGFSGM